MTTFRQRAWARVLEDLNFVLTNRIPRRLFTYWMGRFSRVEHPLVRDVSLALWRRFSSLDLSDASELRFRSVHHCFTRELKPGARPIDTDPAVVVSPCDGIVGACGRVEGTTMLQAKGVPYTLEELLGDARRVQRYRDGHYITLRLTPSMYHRFHAPFDARIGQVSYFSGDVWNVNPVALARVDKLYCKNERAAIELDIDEDARSLALVPVAAVLVAGIRLHFLDLVMNAQYAGPRVHICDARVAKGAELGWFEHGSTIILLASPGFALSQAAVQGTRVKMGQALLRVADAKPRLHPEGAVLAVPRS